MVCIFDRLRGLLKTKFFSNINSTLRKGSRRLPFDFIIFHFFSRRNPSLPYGCTATKRIFDDSAHFYLFPHRGNAKKGRPRILPKIKAFSCHIKVFARLLGKAAQSRTRSSCRAPQSAKYSSGIFFFYSFFFCACICKRKSGICKRKSG